MTTAAPHAGASGRAYLLLTFTTLCWGGNAVFARLAVDEVSPMALVALRWLGALALLLAFAHAHVWRDWPALRERLLFVAAMGAIGSRCSPGCSTSPPIGRPPSTSGSSRARYRCSC